MTSDLVTTDQMVLFWDGWPSQWHRSRFTIGTVTYNCCEQYMMAEKARVFGDESTLAEILATRSPSQQKSLGRQIRHFDKAIWDSVCRGIVYTGNFAKFQQNADLAATLLATGDRTIVEASPYDLIWGIGYRPDDLDALDPANWRGTNWLGIAVMQVRDTLRGRPIEPWLDEQLAARARLPCPVSVR